MNKVTEMALELAHRDKFTDTEWEELRTLVSIVKKSEGTMKTALITIRDKNLYRPYKTMREFCSKTFGWSDRRAQQVVASVAVIAALPDEKRTMVRNERQARELGKAPEEQRAEILEAVQYNGDITAESIRKERLKHIPTTEYQVVDDMGYPVTKNAMPSWERKSEVQDILTGISKARTGISEIMDGDPLYRRVSNLRSKHDKLNEYYNELKGALPAYVCYSCDGVTVKSCKLCGGTGIVSEFEWKSKADPAGHQRRLRALKKLPQEEDNIPF